MKHFIPLLASLLSLTLDNGNAAATPHGLVQRDNSCSGFGSNSFDTSLNPFTLTAVPRDGVSDSKALIVKDVQTVPKVSWLLFSALEETSSWPILKLDGGILRALNPKVPAQVSASLAVPDGTSPSLMLAQFPGPAASIYCAVSEEDSETPVLAVNGRTDLFSLCTNHTAGVRQDLVYQADGNKCGDNCIRNCVAVDVKINL